MKNDFKTFKTLCCVVFATIWSLNLQAQCVPPSNQNGITYTDLFLNQQDQILAGSWQGTNLTYQWYRAAPNSTNFVAISDGSKYQNTTSQLLYIISDYSDRNATFRIVATNGCGSDSHDVVVYPFCFNLGLPYETSDPNAFSNGMFQLVRNIGQSAEFDIDTVFQNNSSYQWQIKPKGQPWANATNGGQYSGTNTRRIAINNLTNANDSLLFRLIATGNICTDTSEAVVIRMYQVLCNMITSQPTDQTVTAGNPVSFSVTDNAASPSYQWEFRLPGNSQGFIVGNNSPTYSYTPNNSETGKEFRCIITDGSCKDTTNWAMLTVIPQSCSLFTTQPTNQTEVEGNNATFTATASSPNTFEQKWQTQPTGGGAWTTVLLNSTTYTTNATLAKNGLNVRSIVTEIAGVCSDTSSVATLTVTSASSCNVVQASPIDFSAQDGGSAAFQVTTQGTGLTYNWEFQTPNTTTWQSAGTGSVGVNNSLLTVSPVNLQDNGTLYRCIVDAGNCIDTSATATLFVSPVQSSFDTIKTYIVDPIINFPVSSYCTNDTFVVPVYIDGGNQNIGAISLTIAFPDNLLQVVPDAANGNSLLHNINGGLSNNITALQNAGSSSFLNTNNISVSWTDNNGVTFNGSTMAFEILFVKHSSLAPVPNPLSVGIFFDTSAVYNNEYADVNAAPLLDDKFTNSYSFVADSSNCVRNIFGNLYYGPQPQPPFTPVYGSQVSVTLKDLNGVLAPIPTPTAIVDGSNGMYQFADVPPGQYQVELNPNLGNYNGDGINSTDALRVVLGFFGTFPLFDIENQAAETDGIPGINSGDALQISRMFIGEITQFTDPITGNELTNWVQQNPILDATTNDVNQNIHVLKRGDVNGSFDPSNLNNGTVSEVTLVTKEVLEITQSGELLEIPFQVEEQLEIGAISMVLNFPYDILTVQDIQLNDKVNAKNLRYTIKEGRIRISWFSASPLRLDPHETMVTIFATTVGDIANAWTPSITRGNETELANAVGEIITAVNLIIPQLVINPQMTVNDEFSAALYPNPASDFASITIHAPQSGDLIVNMYNHLGVLIQTLSSQQVEAGQFLITSSTTDLPAGQYTVQIIFENNEQLIQTTKRLVIVK